MAKSSKVEDYWRENNIENLLKELTQLLVRRMPSDPAIAIVEHLQKKFPKSFKTSSDNMNIFSKTLANNLQMQSPHSDIKNQSTNDVQIDRRSSNQSQISDIVTIPTVGSAFTNLLKSDTNSSKLTAEMSIKNLVFANRLGQQVIKMGKDIRSDRDILDEEVIKPTKITPIVSNKSSMDSSVENLGTNEIKEELSVEQLINYKQQIRTENDRRIHHEELAALAKYKRDKDNSFESDLSKKSEEIQQEKLEDNEISTTQEISTETKSNIKLPHKTTANSKEEEEILNDENIFQAKKQRDRGRQKHKLHTPRTNGPYIMNFRSTMKKINENSICKVCGNPISGEDNQQIVHSQQNSAIPISHSLQPQVSSQSVETTTGDVDDWFESTSDVSAPGQSNPRTPDDAILPSIGSSTFRRNLFQPINDIVEHQPHTRPLIPTDDVDETKIKRVTTPRMSESGVFARSPDTKIPRPPSTRNTPSPLPKKHQTDHQLANTAAEPTIMPSNTGRRFSGWSVHEHSRDDSDEN